MCLKSFESSSSRPVHIAKWAVYFCAAVEKERFVSALCDAFRHKVQVIVVSCYVECAIVFGQTHIMRRE